jgi:lipoprotein-anchoring transpeptidase ErfK/SrfK
MQRLGIAAIAMGIWCAAGAAPRDGLMPALPALRAPLPPGAALPPPIPLLPGQTPAAPALNPAETGMAVARLHTAMALQVAGLMHLSPARSAALQARAISMLAETGIVIDASQLVVVVDRSAGAQTLAVMLARPGTDRWEMIGAAHVSTGQAHRKDYYITPVGVFAHNGAILDFRAQGTFNEHHVRGLGLAGMRVWDFGWQWALKGWHSDGAGGDIRLQMHATDPTYLEARLGHPASEGCVRVSSSMNRFLDRHGVLDADYQRAAIGDIRYRALLAPDRLPSPLAGRLLIVVDSGAPPDAPPTAASRPVEWPRPQASPEAAAQE